MKNSDLDSLLNLTSQMKSYDLEHERFNGIPAVPWVQPAYYYILYRHHASYEYPSDDRRTGAVGLLIQSDQSGTHVDALCHCADYLKLYGGVPVDRHVETPFGFKKLGANEIPPMVKRGVLLDVAGYKGVDYLDEHYGITGDDMRGTEKWEGVRIDKKNILLVRTGNGQFWDNSEKYMKAPGMLKSGTVWASEKDPFAVGIDNVGWDLLPGVWDPESKTSYYGHLHLIAQRGIYIIENLLLEELARDRCYEFLFVGLPLKCRGATGTPLRPLALATPPKD